MYQKSRRSRNPRKRPTTSKKIPRSVTFHARADIIKSPAISEPLIREPRILLFDTENSPILGHAWQRYDTTLVNVVNESFLMGFSAKWLGQSPTICRVLPDYARYRKDPKDDSDLVRELWQLIDQADILVGHNIRRHDIPKFQSACLRHSLTPPSPYKIFDTLTEARRLLSVSSKSLDNLGQYFGVGHKIHEGINIDLWLACMAGDRKAWERMRAYCRQDTQLLEQIFLKLRPYAKPPDLTMWTRVSGCPGCGSTDIEFTGYSPTKTNYKTRVRCRSCGHWSAMKV